MSVLQTISSGVTFQFIKSIITSQLHHIVISQPFLTKSARTTVFDNFTLLSILLRISAIVIAIYFMVNYIL